MMRIAIAGAGGLARVFAHYIHETAHQVVILSRQVRCGGGGLVTKC